MSTLLRRVSETKHNSLVTALVKKYEELGYYVKADHIGHPNGSPPQVGGHIPDIAAYSGYPQQLTIIAEAETCDTLDSAHTEEQWRAFGRSRYSFDTIVPEACYAKSIVNARKWGVEVRTSWKM